MKQRTPRKRTIAISAAGKAAHLTGNRDRERLNCRETEKGVKRLRPNSDRTVERSRYSQ